MAFDEKDTETSPTVVRKDEVTSIEIARDESVPDPGVKLAILARKVVTTDGKPRTVFGRVPQAKVDAGWPGATKTLKAHLFAIIDNIVWND